MSKINIGDEIAFRHKYGSKTKTGYVKSIKRSGKSYICLVEDEDFDYHIITSDTYCIIPTGLKRACGGKNEQ